MFSLTIKDRIYIFFLNIKFFWWFTFSHHPICVNYQKEVFKIRHMFLCRGCTLFYLSFIISFIFLTVNDTLLEIDLINLFILTNILAFPSFFGSIIKTKYRLIKDIYRIFLGIAISVPFITITQSSALMEKLFILILMIFYFTAFKIIRQNSSTDNLLCDNCTNNISIACSNYKKVFETQRDHSRVISDYIQNKLVKSNFLPNLDPTSSQNIK